MPLVTVLSRPNGEPMATTCSPTSRSSELPSVGRGEARDVLGLDHGEVGDRVGADDRRLGGAAVVEADRDAAAVGGDLGDVVVGEDLAVGGQDDAGAGAGLCWPVTLILTTEGSTLAATPSIGPPGASRCPWTRRSCAGWPRGPGCRSWSESGWTRRTPRPRRPRPRRPRRERPREPPPVRAPVRRRRRGCGGRRRRSAAAGCGSASPSGGRRLGEARSVVRRRRREETGCWSVDPSVESVAVGVAIRERVPVVCPWSPLWPTFLSGRLEVATSRRRLGEVLRGRGPPPGIWNQNAAPPPGAVPTRTEPPCRSATARTMESPSPEPGIVRDSAER